MKISVRATYVDGAANSFFLVDGLNRTAISAKYRRDIVSALAVHWPGIRPDGVAFLDPSETADFIWDFYNSDGSFAEFCGNAARCVARYYHDYIRAQDEISFQTAAGVARAEMTATGVRIRMPKKAEEPGNVVALDPELAERARKIGIDPSSLWYVDSGVPHLLVNGVPSAMIGAALRPPTSKLPKGMNVTFWSEDKGVIRAQTFERGVEGFTQACGTGALAVGAFARFHLKKVAAIPVLMPGGQLTVDFGEDQTIFLHGPVRIHFDLSAEVEIP